MQKVIVTDWLQLHVSLPFKDYENLKCARFEIIRQDMQTRNFKSLYSIVDKRSREEVFVLAAEPRSEMCMKNSSGLLKVINKYLYQMDLYEWIIDVLQELKLTFINITRLDIALDFLYFDGFSCKKFIEMFQQSVILKTKRAKVKMMGDSKSVEQGKLTGGITSLKFGLETSDVSYYLYNKSIELEQVKDKAWIKENWLSCGWDGVTDVYRLEFSLHPDTKGIAVLGISEDGEMVVEQVHHFKDLEMIKHIADVWKHYYNSCFNFVYTEQTKKGNYKKQSRCKPVELFNDLQMVSIKMKLSNKTDSSRSTKVFAKALFTLNNELRGTDWDLCIFGNKMLTWLVETRNIKEWASRKLGYNWLDGDILDKVSKARNIELRIIADNYNKTGILKDLKGKVITSESMLSTK